MGPSGSGKSTLVYSIVKMMQ
ncbi:hypothetical protein [Paenibacillus chitinolyticus]